MNATLRYRTLALALAQVFLVAAGSARAIPCLSGFVRGPDGTALAGADLDFTISATGLRILTPGDNTDAGGFYTVCVLPNIYDVSYAPPPGSRLLGRLVFGVDLTAESGRELSIVLEEGQVVAGVVRDQAGIPVFDVDIDVDRVEGGRLYTPGDNTLPDGSYHVVVPAGLHRISFEPPRGSRLRGAQVDSVDVTSDAVLDVTLLEGVLLAGTVNDPDGVGAPEVDVDLREAATGAKVYLANKTTDAAGAYTVAAPAGVFELRYAPDRESHLIAAAVPGFQLLSDATRDVTLERGHRVVFEILGTGDLPLAGADLDVKSTVDGSKLYLPHDRADAAGRAVAVLPAASWDVIIDPPAGADYAGIFLPDVSVSADTTITVRLAGAPRVTVSGRVVDAAGAPVADATFSARAVLDDAPIRLANDRTRADGTFALDLPPIPVDLDVEPPAGSRLMGRRLNGAVATNDTIWADIVLEPGLLVAVSITGGGGRPLSGVDLDFVDVITDDEIFTPGDNTDALGAVTVAVPAGTYRVVATPPVTSGFGPVAVEPVIVQSDTTLAIVVPVNTGGRGDAVLDVPRPNPFLVSAEISYRLARSTDIRLTVYDVRGRRVRVLASGARLEGLHTETWTGRDDAGRLVSSGLYIVRLTSPLGGDTGRVTFVH